MTQSTPIDLEEFHRIIMDNTAMWLNVLDKDANVVMWNKAAEMISGYSKDEVVGKDDIWMKLYPDEEYRNKIYAEALEILNQGKEVVDFETRIRCKDGHYRVLSWNSHDVKDAHGEVIGSLALARDVTELHESNEKLKRLTRELEESNRSLRKLSEIDELTAIHNRRAMDKYLESEWKRHERASKPLSLLYVDIDFFKQYNDAKGHHKGDEVLVSVAGILKRHAKRAVDMAVRFGGEEFAIILPETGHKEAGRIAEELRQDVEQSGIEHRDSKISDVITVSVGVATMLPTREERLSALKEEADSALYRAKKQGRNRVVSGDKSG